MSKAYSVQISLPEGKRLAELTGIDSDLGDCEDYCRLYLALLQTERKNPFVHRQFAACCITSTFIRYGRCFKEGVRVKTQKELLKVMKPDDLETHQIVIDLRDKHYAHSVNRLEEHRISVWLRATDSDTTISSVSVGSYSGDPHPIVLHNLLVLTGRLRSWLKIEIEKEKKRLLEIVKNRFSAEELMMLRGKGAPYRVLLRDLKKARKGT